MHLTHKIALCPTLEQADYFKCAAGTARFVWNWALAEWNRQHEKGEHPNAMRLKKQFNAIKYQLFPWLKDVHRDAHAQPFGYLGKAWNRYFADVKKGIAAHKPRFKKKGYCRDSCYVANDKLSINDKTVVLPKIGSVDMREELRFDGKIVGATISRTANRWYIAVQIDVVDEQYTRQRSGEGVEGIDLGLKAAVTLSTGECIEAPKPLKSGLRRLKIRSRRVSRKIVAAKAVRKDEFSKGSTYLSENYKKSSERRAKLHARISNIRADFTHKLTTRLCSENQTVVMEDLQVKAMLANDKLARALSDVGFGEIRRQMEYKAERYHTNLIIANRWYASSRQCSCCDWKNEKLTLKDREWTCPSCGTHHDRDINAALNLKQLATVTALPVASLPGNGGAVVGGTYDSRESNACQVRM